MLTDTDGTASIRTAPAPVRREKLAGAVLRELAKITEMNLGQDHPGATSAAVEDGSFAGAGHLDIDDHGNVTLVRVADNEDQILKGARPATPMEMWMASQFHGGSPGAGGLPTSAFGDLWLQQFRCGSPFVATFKVPVRELLAMAREGKALLGNIFEGEIVLSGDVAGRFMTEVRDRRDPSEIAAAEASAIWVDLGP